MILDEIKSFFEKECGLLSGRRLCVNMLDEKAHACTLEVSPAPPIIQKYADGSSLRQFVFILATREYFDKEIREQLKANEFYEKLTEWIEEQNEKNNMPALGGGKTAVSMEALSAGYLYDADLPKARYQIQLRLIYEKE